MRWQRFVLMLAAAVALSACGTASAYFGGDDDAAEAQPVAAAAAAATSIEVSDSELGSILVDGDGRTLYLFTSDTDGTSTCFDDCAATWPPVTGDVVAGDGADAALVGSTDRGDGTVQVTYAGHPLYHFAGDQAPGDTNGQGVGDVWFVVGPDGAAVDGDGGGNEGAADAGSPADGAADEGAGSDAYGSDDGYSY